MSFLGDTWSCFRYMLRQMSIVVLFVAAAVVSAGLAWSLFQLLTPLAGELMAIVLTVAVMTLATLMGMALVLTALDRY
jgi:hypothetical protein